MPGRWGLCWDAGGLAEAIAVLGVWPDGSDGTDINSLCRSHDERIVAVADDFCKVHLFQYPCARAKVRPSGVPGGCWGRATATDPPLPPGTEPRVRGTRQPCDQRPVHARRLVPRLARRQGCQHLPVASAGPWELGAGGRHTLPDTVLVSCFFPGRLIRCLTDWTDWLDPFS